eukprot:TRINITY_DN31764_c0_g1_i1.p1 TRINITY_DN31764_c0_g1~~TRINITY_DN31764_c0_g1_i1.p1  ORF type:complete len:445 (-),score=52.11 TRINITY_DN31764_c0_g1_i1:311-1564(-)
MSDHFWAAADQLVRLGLSQSKLSTCVPVWIDNKTCPYGVRLPFDVTAPHNPTPLQVLAILSSYMPIVIVAVLVLETMLRRRTRQLAPLGFATVSSIVNELVIKSLFEEPRPGARNVQRNADVPVGGSCATTCGMPSSHAAVSVGFLALALLNAYKACSALERAERRRQASNDLEQATEVPRRSRRRVGRPHATSTSSSETAAARCRIPAFVSASPLWSCAEMSRRDITAVAFFWCLVLGPVPLSRVLLFDHSVRQILMGSLLGLAEAAAFFAWLAMNLDRPHGPPRRICGCFEHDLQQGEPQPESGASSSLRGRALLSSSASGGSGSVQLTPPPTPRMSLQPPPDGCSFATSGRCTESKAIAEDRGAKQPDAPADVKGKSDRSSGPLRFCPQAVVGDAGNNTNDSNGGCCAAAARGG